MPENKHVQQQHQQQQSPLQQKQQRQAQELQQQQAINANAESSRQPNREGGRPSTSRSSQQTYPNAWRMSVCCSSNSGSSSSIRGCNIQCSSNIVCTQAA